MALALTDAPPAHAQGGDYWQYSAPTYTCTPSCTSPAHLGTSPYPNHATGGGAAGGTVTVSGTATITCTWKSAAGDPPPSEVISQENMVGSYTTQSGTLTYTGPSPVVRYSVHDSSSGTVTLTSPQMSSTYTIGAGGGGGDAIVTYTATLNNVTIQLTGQNSAYQALVGQQITAQVVTGIGTVVGNAWGVTGSAFKTYDPSASSGQLVALSAGAGDLNGQKFYFYDVTGGETVMVTGYPNIQLPDGTTVNVTAKSPNVTFKKPSTIWYVKEGFIQPFTLPQYPGSQLYGLATDPATASQHPNGEDWNPVDITMPSGFSTAGQCCFTQLVTPNHTETISGVVTPLVSGPQGLDNMFELLDYTWTLPGQGAAGDNPSIPTNATGNTHFSVGDQQAASDKFTTYVMFNPPAVGNQGTIWAPLQSYSWSAKTTITYNGSRWTIVPAQSAPTTPSADTIKGSDTSTLPQWSQTYTNIIP